MPRPLRTSCDRCHAQKLKCPKQPGSATCARCSRAGAECVFSPAGPAARRSPSSITTAAMAAPPQTACDALYVPLVGGYDTPPLDWLALDLEGYLDTSPEQQQQEEEEQQDSQSQFPRPPEPARDERSACVRQLAALAVDLDQVARDMAPPADPLLPHSLGDDDDDATAAAADLYTALAYIEALLRDRALERLFALSQQLAELYPGVLRHLVDDDGGGGAPAGDDDDGRGPDWVHLLEGEDATGQLLTPPRGRRRRRKRPRIDVFLFNLLTAAHAKVSDVFDVVIASAGLCARVAAALPPELADRHRVTLPELRVGDGFVASAASASAMQALLLAHIFRVLGERVARLEARVREVASAPAPVPAEEEEEEAEADDDDDGGDDRATRVLVLQCELLAERNQSQIARFNRLRERLTSNELAG